MGVAVSGGADSVALLQILSELRQELGIVLSILHLNHKLRGAEAEEDEHFVRQLAAAHKFELLSETGDVKSHAARKKLSLETAARELRYEFFTRALSSGLLNKIATAHTIDDQAETVLLKLARGAGTRGLAGIYPKIAVRCAPSIPRENHVPTVSAKLIVRPLLSTYRRELESYLAETGQTWREDSSNRELVHTRNRVRHEILPRLAELVNSRVHQTLAEVAEIARSEEEFWAIEIARLLPTAWKPGGRGGSISRKNLDEFDLTVRRRLVRSVAQSLGLNLEFQHVEQVLHLGRENARAALPQNWSATLLKGEIRFSGVRTDTVDYEYFLPVPGKIAVPEANITVEVLVLNRKANGNERREQMLDLRFIKSGLVVRNWRPGDRFWPENTKEPRKIKELLQERHVTGQEKKTWPVLAVGDEIVWVRDLGIRQHFRAKGDKGLLIRYSQTPPTPADSFA